MMARLIALSILFLLSLLCITSAPTYHLWMAAIVVTEFPWIFLLLIAALLLLGLRPMKYNMAGTAIGIAAMLQFSFPVMMAYRISQHLGENLEARFGKSKMQEKETSNGAPFELARMLTGITDKPVPYFTKTYFIAGPDSLSLDFYPSLVKGSRPCVIVIHGGSWAGGDSRQLPELNSSLAWEGYNVASINYHLAPKYQFPAPLSDVNSAIHFLKAHAGALNIDTNNFVLLGRSAGAQIALLAAYTFHDPAIRGVVSFYGPADMVWGYSLPANPLVMDSRKVMEDYLGGTIAQVPRKYAESSPVLFVSTEAPPTLMIHGPNDPLVAYEHNIHLIGQLKKYGIKYYLLTLPWATHGCDYTLNGPSGQLSTYSVKNFLGSVTSK